jgi:hypothetical protein
MELSTSWYLEIIWILSQSWYWNELGILPMHFFFSPKAGIIGRKKWALGKRMIMWKFLIILNCHIEHGIMKYWILFNKGRRLTRSSQIVDKVRCFRTFLHLSPLFWYYVNIRRMVFLYDDKSRWWIRGNGNL